jgi:hypothetical protein
MPFPTPELTGWAPSSVTNGSFYEGTDSAADLSARVEQIRQMQMMSGQEPIPSVSGMEPKAYLQALAAQNSEVAGSLGSEFGYDLPTIMQEASAAGSYQGDPAGGVLGRTLQRVGDVGEFVSENPALLFAAPLGLAALGGYWGAGAAGAGATAGICGRGPCGWFCRRWRNGCHWGQWAWRAKSRGGRRFWRRQLLR